MSTFEPAAAAELFLELASETRCAILASLLGRPAKLSTFARDLGVTVQEVHRNVNRMAEFGLLRRADGVFYLTEFGRMATRQAEGLLFMKSHARFFEEHTLDGLPDKFAQRIAALRGCTLVSSVMPVLERLKKLEAGTDKKLKIMVSQAWVEEGKILAHKASEGAEVQTLVGKNTVFPKEVIESIMPPLNKLRSAEMIKSRMVDHVSIALYISDVQAAVMFPATAK
ncbi:MAG: helix-turn-helix domain-containing protein [Nitrososphaera sp.]|jgi:predicted transcriptional regulator